MGFDAIKLIVNSKITTFKPLEFKVKFSEIYQQLIEDHERNNMILQDIIKSFEQGRYPLMLTERKDHLQWFQEQLKFVGINNIFVLKGGMRKKDREAVMKELRECNSNRIVLATGRYIGEGFDDSKLDTLFLTLPISWHGTLQQYVGRLHRAHFGKQSICVYDYVDVSSPVLLKMYKKRVKKYKLMGYTINE